MLKHKRLAIAILKDEFKLNDLQLRKSLIRLFFQGKQFGKIDAEGKFLDFPGSNDGPLGIKDILDWNVSEFNLSELMTQGHQNSDTIVQFSEIESNQIGQDMDLQTTQELELSRSKETSQKDLISIEIRFGIAGYKLTVRITIKNQSENAISKAKLKINYPTVLKLIGIKPKVEFTKKDTSVDLNIGIISGGEEKQYVIYYRQTDISPISINGILQYASAGGFVRFLRLADIGYNLALPEIIPATIKPTEIKEVMKNPLNYKTIVGFGIPPNINLVNMQKHLEQVAQNAGFLPVSSIAKEDKNFFMTFFFGKSMTPTGKEFNILVVPQIKNNKVMGIYGCCPYEQVISNLLRKLSLDLTNLLNNEGIIDSKVGLIDVNCIKCGTLLEGFTEKGDTIVCKRCNFAQKPW
jgi:hypothetical protein